MIYYNNIKWIYLIESELKEKLQVTKQKNKAMMLQIKQLQSVLQSKEGILYIVYVMIYQYIV